jgi:hypothetical protein
MWRVLFFAQKISHNHFQNNLNNFIQAMKNTPNIIEVGSVFTVKKTGKQVVVKSISCTYNPFSQEWQTYVSASCDGELDSFSLKAFCKCIDDGWME